MLFSNGILAPGVAAGLFAPPSSFSDDEISHRLKPNLMQLESVLSSGSRLTRLKSGHWLWDGTEIDSTDFKIGNSSKSQQIVWYAGYFPNRGENLNTLLFSNGHRMHLEDVRGFFSGFLKVGSWEIPNPKPIFQIEEGELQSWWKIETQFGRVFWLREQDLLWGEEVVIPLQASAKALLYRENKVASSATGLEQIELSELLDVSYLRSKLFRVLNCLGEKISFDKCGNFARSLGGFYDYPFDSKEYSEMVGYYSIQRAMDWHRGIQNDSQKSYFENFGLKGPIDVFVRADASNAPFYVPTSSVVDSPNPVIVVSTGEERDVTPGTLSYLSKDSDVYFHEFAHHIIYRSVQPKSAQSQSRALHEGLSDYFTFAITGNNALGESIFGGEPLRVGDVSEPLDISLFAPLDPYNVSRYLSSILWSLRLKQVAWQANYNQIDKIVWDAIDLLPSNATLYQFACATYVSAINFELENGLSQNSIAGVIASEFFTRGYFSSESVVEGNQCPLVSDVLSNADLSEGMESQLPKLSTPKGPVTFTGSGKSALAPFGGSLYQPVQPRKTFCGSLAHETRLKNSIPLVVLIPILFIGWMLCRSVRWLSRIRKTRRCAGAK